MAFNFKRLKREEFDELKPKIDWSMVESFPFPAPFEEQQYIGDAVSYTHLLIERDLRQCKFDSAAMKTVEALDGKL